MNFAASSPQTNILQLNVTGNSINPQADHDVSQSLDMEEEDGTEELDEMIHPQWGRYLPFKLKC